METKELIKKHIDSKFLSDNGTLQIVSSENYMKVLKENQAKIIEIDRDYVQKFVKIGAYLKSTQQNIFSIYDKVLDKEFKGDNFFDLSDLVIDGKPDKLNICRKLKDETHLGMREAKDLIDSGAFGMIDKRWGVIIEGYQNDNPRNIDSMLIDFNQHIISYHSLIINALNMIKSLNEDDMITFYELYELFDKLGIFDSQWQKNMIQKLSNISSSIDELKKSLDEVNSTIRESIDDLNIDISRGFDLIYSKA